MVQSIYLFSHIEKTAGMSIYELIKDNFPHSSIIGDRIERDVFYTINKIERGEIRLIQGHFKYGLHEMLGMGSYLPVYATFLRDPVEREISYYYYRRNRNDQSVREAVDEVDVVGWMTHPARRRNGQSSFVCGYFDPPSFSLAMDRLLCDYAMFGITEYMNASIDALAAAFGLETVTYPRVNTGSRPALDDQTYERIAGILGDTDRHDFELYRMARALFEAEHAERIAAHMPAPVS